jgi:hypothetical protein
MSSNSSVRNEMKKGLEGILPWDGLPFIVSWNRNETEWFSTTLFIHWPA